MKSHASLLTCVVLSLIAATGCGGDDLNRRDLYGKVSYKGEPVPYGTISFRPDHSKGGKGPTGFARIEDGAFDTSGNGKGAMLGPIKVFVEGAVSKEPMAASLFPLYRTTMEVNEETEELNIEVPERNARNGKRR